VGVNTSKELPIVGDWPTQTKIMQVMLLTVVICAPTMLLAKPIIYGCCLAPKHVDEAEAEADTPKANDDHFVAAKTVEGHK